MLPAAMKRLAAVLAVFAVVFAPAGSSSDRGAAAASDDGDLSGAVLAPTFTSSELAIARTTGHVTDDDRTTVAHPLISHDPPPGSRHQPARLKAARVEETDSSADPASPRAPPAS